MILKKVSFGTARIQKLRRVTLDQNLLMTLGLEIGDFVRIELDTENGTILISGMQKTKTQEAHDIIRLGGLHAKGK